MFKNNKNLLVIAVIAIVNALGYGIIIPILYSYSLRYGLNDFQNGLLFATFSICQFISTPIIGRLSDKYGRKPLLVISLAGTAVSFLVMAFAPNAIFLFLARALDGITAGNIPVASAVISDTTEPKDRARGFGIIGASFGFGFIFGPAISAMTIGFGMAVPFIIAAAVTTFTVILTIIVLPETNVHKGEIGKGKIFNFSKLFHMLWDEAVGTTLLLSLIYSFAFGVFIYAYQPFAVKVIAMSAKEINLNFMVFGIVGLISQVVVIPRASAKLGERKALTIALGCAVVTFMGLFFARTLLLFTIVAVFHALANGFVNPLVQALLSKEVDAKSQGSILGLNASYISIGMILGPVVGGIVATVSIPSPFLVGSATAMVCMFLSLQILRQHHAEQTAF